MGPMMTRIAPTVALTQEQRIELERWSRAQNRSARVVNRAKIILYAAAGWNNSQIADELDLQNHTVALWRRRFIESGVPGIAKDAPGRGRKPTVQYGEAEVIRKTTQETPPRAAHWSTRSMAREMNISEASVRRIWHRSGLKPHLLPPLKVSNDPNRTQKAKNSVRS